MKLNNQLNLEQVDESKELEYNSDEEEKVKRKKKRKSNIEIEDVKEVKSESSNELNRLIQISPDDAIEGCVD